VDVKKHLFFNALLACLQPRLEVEELERLQEVIH
jgi:hypothetical protein